MPLPFWYARMGWLYVAARFLNERQVHKYKDTVVVTVAHTHTQTHAGYVNENESSVKLFKYIKPMNGWILLCCLPFSPFIYKFKNQVSFLSHMCVCVCVWERGNRVKKRTQLIKSYARKDNASKRFIVKIFSPACAVHFSRNDSNLNGFAEKSSKLYNVCICK